MQYVVGLDLSLMHTGVAIIDHKGVIYNAGIVPKKIKGSPRLAYIIDAIEKVIEAMDTHFLNCFQLLLKGIVSQVLAEQFLI